MFGMTLVLQLIIITPFSSNIQTAHFLLQLSALAVLLIVPTFYN